MGKGIVAGMIASFQIVILFVVVLIIYEKLGQTEIGNNPQAQAVLESGKQATIKLYNWWSLADDIGGVIVLLGIIFGLIYLVIKIVENENGDGGSL